MSVLIGSCPIDCIPDNGLYVLVSVGGIGFVTGLEVEHLPSASEISAAGTENPAGFVAGNIDQFIRLGNIVELDEPFFHRERKFFRNALGDRMAGTYAS